MRVEQLMTTALRTVGPGTTVLEARGLLDAERIRHLLVTSAEGWMQGIVTGSDFARAFALIAAATER